MPRSNQILHGITLAFAFSLVVTSLALAGPPDPTTSLCTVMVVQGPCPSPACLAGAVKIARLCPVPDWDRIQFQVRVLDAAGNPCPGVNVKPAELGGTLNLWNGGFTSAVTNAQGDAFVTATAGHGCGRLGVCADAVFLQCVVEVRTPDVANGAIPASCPLPMGGTMSFVNSSDVINSACGFIAKFGPVVAGVNDCYDLNCNGSVNASDVNGTVCPPFGLNGGVLQHFGHGSGLGRLNSCP